MKITYTYQLFSKPDFIVAIKYYSDILIVSNLYLRSMHMILNRGKKTNIYFIIILVPFLLISCPSVIPIEEDSDDNQSENTNYNEKMVGLWTYTADFDGASYSTNDLGYNAASASTAAGKFNSDKTSQGGTYDGTNFTPNSTPKGIWSIDGNLITVANSETGTDTYQFTFESDYKKQVWLLKSSTDIARASGIDKLKMYYVKEE